MKIFLISLVAALSLLGVMQITSPPASAQFNASKDQACEGLAAGDDFIDCNSESQSSGGVQRLITTGLDLLSLLAGIIAVVMVIFGGFKFMTSQGDSSKLASAKSTIIFAIVGVIIVVLSQTIVFFVLRETTSVSTPQEENNSCVDAGPNEPC